MDRRERGGRRCGEGGGTREPSRPQSNAAERSALSLSLTSRLPDADVNLPEHCHQYTQVKCRLGMEKCLPVKFSADLRVGRCRPGRFGVLVGIVCVNVVKGRLSALIPISL